MYSEKVTTNNSLWLLAILAMAAMCVMLTLDVPAAGLNEHAVAKHGEDAWAAYDRWQSGMDCCHIYRHLRRNRIYRICGEGALRDILITTVSGKAVTVFVAPTVYCQAKVIGAEYLGTDGYCP